MTELRNIAPDFVDMAHRIVWATVATVDPTGQPRTRVLHPIWEWDGDQLRGWIATTPTSPKAGHLAVEPRVSVNYWDQSQDTCTADCHTTWLDDPDDLTAAWNRFRDAPAPVGYDPSIIPDWTSPTAAAFGVLALRATRLRVMPGTLMSRGEGTLKSWSATT